MRLFLLCLAAFLAIPLSPARAADTPATRRPNVLLICVDDLKPLLGCYGNSTVKSPHIDRLAARGLTFDRAYTNQAVCSPSRNALMTGLRPGRLGIYDLATHFRLAAPDAITLPQHFKTSGWRTEGIGKIFHAGNGNHEDPISWSSPFFKGSAPTYLLPESDIADKTGKPAGPISKLSAKDPRGAAWEAADVPDDAYRDGQLANEAIARLQSAAANPQSPFFLAVGFLKPHLPFCAPKRYWDLYDRAAFPIAPLSALPDGAPDFAGHPSGELRRYSAIPDEGPLSPDLQRTLIHGYHAAVSYTDAMIGKVLDSLDALALTDKTIVVLWGDHGWHLGDHGLWCKHSNYEQAARIPLIIAGQGIATGRSPALVESVDLYPTLAALANLPAPKDLDGTSFAPTLRNPATPTKAHILHTFPRQKNLIGRALRTAQHRLVEWKIPGAPADSAQCELYDYDTDPSESQNLASSQPETVATLRAILNSSYPESKPQLKSPKPNRTPPTDPED